MKVVSRREGLGLHMHPGDVLCIWHGDTLLHKHEFAEKARVDTILTVDAAGTGGLESGIGVIFGEAGGTCP